MLRSAGLTMMAGQSTMREQAQAYRLEQVRCHPHGCLCPSASDSLSNSSAHFN